jgi:hypothetical protein
METNLNTNETLEQRRARLFQDWDTEYPPVKNELIITNSGLLEVLPDDLEERNNFFEANGKWGGV